MKTEVVIKYSSNTRISAEQFVDVLRRSTLGERRPIDDLGRMEKMVEGASLTVTAWSGEEEGGQLIGVARALTDFCYSCYLSELAVDVAFQGRGIGRELVRCLGERLEDGCKIRLVSAPAANDFYPKIGFSRNDKCWELLVSK